ncbi:hypothetical protein E8E12_010578 [Didymella heteroderae]|uniref:Uncharacterized protein n=1 Tax=Didymella heteroderae TaxID=1769908 RepID=A0A9P5C360_9PLEO|nr:hypothetical protein E8E12_010578 [Didymella heteroderae]
MDYCSSDDRVMKLRNKWHAKSMHENVFLAQKSAGVENCDHAEGDLNIWYPQSRTTLATHLVIVDCLICNYIGPYLIAVPLLLNDSPLDVFLRHEVSAELH